MASQELIRCKECGVKDSPEETFALRIRPDDGSAPHFTGPFCSSCAETEMFANPEAVFGFTGEALRITEYGPGERLYRD